MDKKDIYEHLAKIYLDASLEKKKKSKKHPFVKNFLAISLSFLFGFSLFFLLPFNKNDKPANSHFALVLQHGPAKINFNFNPACKEIYAINLNGLNAARFRAIGFSVKKTNFRDSISLRVEFTNSFKETSEVYLTNIPARWQDFTIPLSRFKKISDWSQMSSLSFIVEEWNTKENNGVVYVDNVGLLKNN